MLTLKEETMLGPIPCDWDARPLRTLLKAHFPGEWGEDRGLHMVSVLRSTNLTNEGRLDLTDVARRALSPEHADLLTPHAGDILLERSGGGPQQPVGRVGFVEADMPGHAFSNFLHLLRPDVESVSPRFLGWVLWRINRTGRILRLEQQTTQMRNLNFRDYLTMPVPVPPRQEQERIAHLLDAIDVSEEQTRQVLSACQRLKTSLGRDLLTGQVRTNVARSGTVAKQ